jgi:hypothetical protein
MPIYSQSFYWIYLSYIKKLECFGFFAMANGIPLLKNIVSFCRPILSLSFLLSVNEFEGCLRQLAEEGGGRGQDRSTKRSKETKTALTKTTAASVILFSICLSRLLVGSTVLWNIVAIHYRFGDADT